MPTRRSFRNGPEVRLGDKTPFVDCKGHMSGYPTYRESVCQSLVCIQSRSSLGGSGKYSGGIGKRPKRKQTTLFIVDPSICNYR
jgi:hypothetical protein